LVQNLNNKLR